MLAQGAGSKRIHDGTRFGFADDLPPTLSEALRAGPPSVIGVATASSIAANGGHHITATRIDSIHDRHGQTIFTSEAGECRDCRNDAGTGKQSAPPISTIAAYR
ncbi:MAG: hypothetical protein FWD68_21075 [Alphaproteobacteria bacterium]|nr:hypothetical protein [Alphaproteobacteria bacterium]